MNAYLMYDKEEQRREDVHTLQVITEEEESELADHFDDQLKLSLLQALLNNTLTHADQKAVTQAFEDNVEFQDAAAQFLRYAAEVVARNQMKINRSFQ